MEPVIITSTNRLSRHYAQRTKQILSRFNDIRESIQHEGMKGSRVEQEVRKFLIDFLPEVYQYSSGIVIDNSGGECDRSRQEDILIIDRFFNPKLFLDEEPSIYPVEVVYCGIEVKTTLDARELKKAVDNIASLKSLKFARTEIAHSRGDDVYLSQTTGPFGIIFAFDTEIKSANTLLSHFATALKGTPYEVWPDIICILNRGVLAIDRKNTKKPIFQLCGLRGQDDEGKIGEILVNPPPFEFFYHGFQYPVVNMNGQHFVVDVARTLIMFLNHLHHLLISKVIIKDFDLLTHYMGEQTFRVLALPWIAEIE